MEIDLDKLAAAGIALTLDGPAGTRRQVTLGPCGELTGKVESGDDGLVVDLAGAKTLPVTAVTWPLSRGRFALAGTAQVGRPKVKLRFPRGGGAIGEVLTGGIKIGGMALELESLSQPLKASGLALRGVGLALDGKGAVGIVAERLAAKQVDLTVGGVEVSVHGLVLEGLGFRRGGNGHWKLEVQALRCKRATVTRDGTLAVADGAVVGGLTTSTGGHLEVSRVEIPTLRLSHDLAQAGQGPAREPAKTPRDASSSRLAQLDLSALDRLNGKVDVDLTADATVPVIGSRRATHHFRLSVDHGRINYHRLEKSLSRLEDALLDFELQGKRLVLEVDLALKKKPLVTWQLTDEEVGFARQRQVRLRRLLRYELPRSTAPRTGPPAVELRELGFANVDIALKMLGGGSLPIGDGTLQLGVRRQSAIAQLRVQGQLGHRPAGRPPKGQLTWTAERLSLGADQLPLGSRQLSVAAAQIGAIAKGTVKLAGLGPQSVAATVEALVVDGLTLSPG